MIDARVEVAFDAGVRTAAASRTWTDVSDYVELQHEIAIKRGKPNGDGVTVPADCTLTLDNTDGRFTPGLASGAYYPDVRLGRPLRVLLNLLDDPGFEGGSVAEFSSLGNATRAIVTTPVYRGARALSVTATAAANASVNTATGTSGKPVIPGEPVIVMCLARAATIARTIQPRVRFYDAAGALVSTHLGTGIADSTSAWTLGVLELEVPETARFASAGAQIVSPGAGEVHYFDDFFIGQPRFTGYVDEWVPEWPSGTDAEATTTVRASGRLAQIGEGAELRSIIETEIMADDPIAYYPMGESHEFGHCLDLTGNDTIGLYAINDIADGGITLADARGPGTDGLSAPTFEPNVDGDGTASRAMLAYFDDQGMTTCTIECFYRLPARNDVDAVAMISLYEGYGNDGDFKYLQALAFSAGDPPTSGVEGSYAESHGGVLSTVGNSSTVYDNPGENAERVFAVWADTFANRTHHIAVTYQPHATNPVVTTYIDGELFVTKTGDDDAALMSTMADFRLLVVGAYSTDSGSRNMVVCHAAVFDSILSADRIAAHAAAGLTGFEDELAADRIERYAGYAGVEATEIVSDAGTVPLAHIDTTGKTPEALLRILETTENGVLYDRRDGKLGFRDRDHRYQATSAFTLDVDAHEVGADLRPTLDRTALVNEATATSSSDSTISQRYVDQTFADETGPQRVALEIASLDLDQLYQSCAWRVNRYKEPTLRISTLAPVDVLPLAAAKRSAIAAADISTRLTVDGLPAQLGTTADYFVEGVTEVIGVESWRFQFNVTPSEPYDDLWVLNDASLSDLGTTTTLAL